MRAKILFVDFPDAPANATTEEHFMHLPQTVEFYDQLSYGRMNLQLEPVHKWYRMNESAADWDATFRTPPYNEGARRTVQLADPEVDFSGVDVVYILTSETYPYFLNAAHFPPTGFIVADGNDIRNISTGSIDMNQAYNGPRIMMHEFGHNLGLPDLYSYDGHNDFLGQWDTMANTYGLEPTMIAYSRWKFGWLDNNQVYCQQTAQEEVYLTPIEQEGGVKAVMVPLSNTKMVVVDSRRAQSYKQGALVYLIDTTIATGQGAVVAYPNRGIEKADAALVAGESVTVEGVTIEVLEAGAGHDLVRVTRGSDLTAESNTTFDTQFTAPFSLIDTFPFTD